MVYGDWFRRNKATHLWDLHRPASRRLDGLNTQALNLTVDRHDKS